MAIGQSMSYYFFTDDDMTFISYLAGRVDAEGKWEFLKSEAVVGYGEDSRDAIENIVAKNLTSFIIEKAQPFWKDDDVSANENTFGHPV